MRCGLDFAWSRPGVDAILAGGFTFVLRYLSYDASGKNLTRKEADTYLAHNVDVVSNWEYAIDAALNGYGQGVRDATEGQRQHLACGGDPDAPIYFSVDFDATAGQQGAIDAYLGGCASVIGASRVGVYGGYWVVKRCLDNGSAVWGWQTRAWSGEPTLWDPRAAIRQVQNGVTVGGGADCDINTTDVANFGQWFGPGGDPGGVFPGDGSTVERGIPDMLLIKATGSDAVYVYNGAYRTYQGSPTAVAEMRGAGVPFLEVEDLSAYGIEFSPAEFYADRDRSRAADAKVVASTPGAGAGPTHDELVQAAFEGAERAEDS
jgi:hypothetical protein